MTIKRTERGWAGHFCAAEFHLHLKEIITNGTGIGISKPNSEEVN